MDGYKHLKESINPMKKISFILLLIFPLCLQAQQNSKKWAQTLKEARGQSVYFYGWGGDNSINRFFKQIAREVSKEYGIEMNFVKVPDIALAVSKIFNEKKAGKNTNGSVDMLWINGKNFKSLKEFGLLSAPFLHELPNSKYIDQTLPYKVDFSVPTEGLEAPFGASSLLFIYDKKRLSNPPKNAQELLRFVKTHPNKFTYPAPPEFHGSSFLKQLLIELSQNNPALYASVKNQTQFAKITQPLWDYLAQIKPYLYSTNYPSNINETYTLFRNKALDLVLTFNPQTSKNKILKGEFPKTATTYAFDVGALSNLHFLAISFNSSAKAGAKAVINYLLSAEIQKRKQDPKYWGDLTVLDPQKIQNATSDFKKVSDFSYKKLSEPHPDWMQLIEKEWKKRHY